MKNEKLSGTARRTYSIFGALLAVALLVIVGLMVHIGALKGVIADYKAASFKQSARLATYEQLACNTTPQLTAADTVTTYRLDVAGVARGYRVHTPANFDPSLRYPVILSFDGIDGSGAQMESYAGLDTLPALIVYPDSLPGKQGFTAWQGAPYSQEGSYDIQFVRSLLDTLPGQYCIDSAAIYAVGMSNGGAFATIVGCELGANIRAVASVSGAYYSTCKNEARIPSLLVLHSVDDNRVPFYGEVARGLPEIPRWVRDQASTRSCQGKALVQTTASSKQTTWYDCKDGSLLRFAVLNGQEHGWLKVPADLQKDTPTTAKYVWDFFETVQ